MFLISWNVAGWSSTSHAIRESFGSIHDFFVCTEADIICLQECKGTLAKLNASPVDMGASDPPPSRRPTVAPVSRLSALREAPSKSSASTATASASVGGGENDGVEGWESFWSFSGKQHRGFNGVVTFARKGLTWRCDNEPFDQPEFNEEGRVVVTHHSAFVLVNVYVPNARGGARHNFKFQFLYALEAKMEQLRRDTKKPVILVGDLNMTYRALDGAWTLRRVHLGTVLELVSLALSTPDTKWTAALPHLSKAALHRVVAMLTHHLCARVWDTSAETEGAGEESSPSSDPASSVGTGVVSVDASELSVDGDTLNHAAFLELRRQLQECGYAAASGIGRGGMIPAAPPVPLRALYDVGFRNAFAGDFIKAFPCTQNEEVFAVVRYCGLAPHSDASAAFMSRLLQVPLPISSEPALQHRLPSTLCPRAGKEEGEAQQRQHCFGLSPVRMFDSFLLTDEIVAAQQKKEEDGDDVQSGASAWVERLLLAELELPQLHPYCPCPYTCWDQSRNRRLENEGTRLDYILVDAALLPAVVCRGETANNRLPIPVESPPSSSAPLSEEDFFSEMHGCRCKDGARRAMANGAYPPAPYDGTGMPSLAPMARERCFDGLPSTGLFVTPPQFSDHIGVGLVLDLSRLGPACTSSSLLSRTAKVVEEHKCMYRPPVGLHSFFAAAVKKPLVTEEKPLPVAGADRKRSAENTVVTATGSRVGSVLDTIQIKAPRTESTPAAALPAIAPESNREPSVVDVDDL